MAAASAAAPGGVITKSEDFWRLQLEAIYRKRNPYKLGKVPELLEKYKGQEALLYRKVCSQYDLDPLIFYAGVDGAAPAVASPLALVASAPRRLVGGVVGAARRIAGALFGSRPSRNSEAQPVGALSLRAMKGRESLVERDRPLSGGATFSPVPRREACFFEDCHDSASKDGTRRTLSFDTGVPSSPARRAAGEVTSVRTSAEFWQVQLEAIYRRRNPYKLDRVPSFLQKYKGREALLYRKVCTQYDLDPLRFYADPHAWSNEGDMKGEEGPMGLDSNSDEDCVQHTGNHDSSHLVGLVRGGDLPRATQCFFEETKPAPETVEPSKPERGAPSALAQEIILSPIGTQRCSSASGGKPRAALLAESKPTIAPCQPSAKIRLEQEEQAAKRSKVDTGQDLRLAGQRPAIDKQAPLHQANASLAIDSACSRGSRPAASLPVPVHTTSAALNSDRTLPTTAFASVPSATSSLAAREFQQKQIGQGPPMQAGQCAAHVQRAAASHLSAPLWTEVSQTATSFGRGSAASNSSDVDARALQKVCHGMEERLGKQAQSAEQQVKPPTYGTFARMLEKKGSGTTTPKAREVAKRKAPGDDVSSAGSAGPPLGRVAAGVAAWEERSAKVARLLPPSPAAVEGRRSRRRNCSDIGAR